MSDIKKHLRSDVRASKNAKIAIAVSEYNSEITQTLLESCRTELVDRGVFSKDIKIVTVPGAFELPSACQRLAASKKYDAVIALGAIVRGETLHFDLIAFAAADGIMKISLDYNIPVIFGVLATDTVAQARDRVKGGKRGDKGVEAALTALKVLALQF